MEQPGWKAYLSDRSNVIMVLATVATLVVTLVSYTRFLTMVESRTGAVFVDPIHVLMGPVDLTWPIFVVLYGALVLAIVTMAPTPAILFRAVRAYTMLIGLRLICMWLLPLDPPTTMIALNDPFVQVFTTGDARPLTRDLFFSGHTSILCLMGFVVPGRGRRVAFFVMAAAVGAAVILQHVHYSIDVIVAPLAAWAAASLSGAANTSVDR